MLARTDDVMFPECDDVMDRSDTAQAVVLPTTAALFPNESGSSVTALAVDVVQRGLLLGDVRVGTRARRYGAISDMLLKKVNMKIKASWSMLKRRGRRDTLIIASSVISSDLLCTT